MSSTSTSPAHQLNASPAINAFLDKALAKYGHSPARDEAVRLGACRVCLQVRPDCLSSECPTGRRCHYRQLANQRFAALNPDTHCPDCGEVLSIYSHCWRCHCPLVAPAQDKAPYCEGQCGICSCISPTTQPATATPSK